MLGLPGTALPATAQMAHVAPCGASALAAALGQGGTCDEAAASSRLTLCSPTHVIPTPSHRYSLPK